jgi:hypothetical protein
MRRITNKFTIRHPRQGLSRTASAPVGAQTENDVNDLGLRKVSFWWTTPESTDAPQGIGSILPPFSKQSLDSSDMADAGCPRAQLGEQARSKSAPPRLEK